LVVEGDRGGEAAEACEHAFSEAVERAGAVAFEGQEVFAGSEDALDALADRCQVRAVAGLVFAAWPDERGAAFGNGGGELAAGVALIAEQDHGAVSASALEQGQADRALVDLRRSELQRPWCAVRGEDRVQPEAPEVAGVRAAVAVVGGIPERGALDRLTRASAFDRGRVDRQQIVIEPRLSLANMPISHSNVSASRRRRLKYPGCWGSLGNKCPSRFCATARNRRSDGMPMIAWATQSVTTSASVTLRAAFFRRSGRRSSAVTNTVVSSRSRSASIVASKVDGAY
jgi:hypothetical protein